MRIVAAGPRHDRIFIDHDEIPHSRHAKGMDLVLTMMALGIPTTNSQALNQHQAQMLIAVGQRLLEVDLAPFIHTEGMPTDHETARFKHTMIDRAVGMLKEKLLAVGEVYRRVFPVHV